MELYKVFLCSPPLYYQRSLVLQNFCKFSETGQHVILDRGRRIITVINT